MKRALLSLFLVLSLFVLGCGGGGGGTTTSVVPGGGGDGGGVGISGPVGTLTVVFGPGQTPSAPVFKDDNVSLRNGYVLPQERGFRVSVCKYETIQVIIGYSEDDPPTPFYRTDTIRTYFNSAENTAPGTLTLKVPVDTGYLVEIVSFDKDPMDPLNAPLPFQMIRYGYQDNVTISEGANTIPLSGRPGVLPISDNTILFSRTQQITGGNAYTMNVTYNSKVPLKNNFNFSDSISSNFVFDDTNIENTLYKVGVPFTRTAPVGVMDDNVYFQGQFYINDSMLSTAEQQAKRWKKYRLNAPATYNNDIYQKLYLPGDVIIVIP